MPDSIRFPIVLTATIIPNAPLTRHVDIEARRREYLESIAFYSQHAEVHFLENSSYDLLHDADFAALSGCHLHKFPMSEKPERGKGYQELEMLDRWVDQVGSDFKKFLKITGRYKCRNIRSMLRSMKTKDSVSLMIDIRPRPRAALSSMFLIDSSFYRNHISGIYEECDDNAKKWAERVLYVRLSDLPGSLVQSLPMEPDWEGISGTFATNLESPRLRFHLKSMCRRVNRLFDSQRLWYGKH